MSAPPPLRGRASATAPPPGDPADSYTARCHSKHANQLPLATAILLSASIMLGAGFGFGSCLHPSLLQNGYFGVDRSEPPARVVSFVAHAR